MSESTTQPAGSPTGAERLVALYDHPGPYVSVYVRHDPTQTRSDPVAGIGDRVQSLLAAGATRRALEAIEARLSLPVFGDVGGRAVLAAADGTTVADTNHEGPVEDFFAVESLPYAAPILEWDQWKVPHLAVTAAPGIYEVVSFLPGNEPEIRPCGATSDEAALTVGRLSRTAPVDLILIGGATDQAEELRTSLRGVVPIRTEVTVLSEAETATPDEFAGATVRAVADKVARATVACLSDFRFLLAHGGAVQGVEATLDALRRGAGNLLLVHDDPTDSRRAVFGDRPDEVGVDPTPGSGEEGRLVDVAIRSALLQDMAVRVLPSTGPRGPDEDIALVELDPTATTAPAG